MLFSCRCPVCNYEQAGNDICYLCFAQFTFLNNACKKCQEPFEYSVAGVDTCVKCANEELNFYSNMRCALVYNEILKNMIIRFKNNSDFVLKNIFNKFIRNCAQDLIQDSIIIPVPLYKKRLIWRGYNQSIVLAENLLKFTNATLLKEGLIRTKDTNLFQSKTIIQRKEKVVGAFIINSRYKNYIKGKKITILDDVITTGSTVFECAKILSKYEPSEINIIAIGRRLKKKS